MSAAQKTLILFFGSLVGLLAACVALWYFLATPGVLFSLALFSLGMLLLREEGEKSLKIILETYFTHRSLALHEAKVNILEILEAPVPFILREEYEMQLEETFISQSDEPTGIEKKKKWRRFRRRRARPLHRFLTVEMEINPSVTTVDGQPAVWDALEVRFAKYDEPVPGIDLDEIPSEEEGAEIVGWEVWHNDDFRIETSPEMTGTKRVIYYLHLHGPEVKRIQVRYLYEDLGTPFDLPALPDAPKTALFHHPARKNTQPLSKPAIATGASKEPEAITVKAPALPEKPKTETPKETPEKVTSESSAVVIAQKDQIPQAKETGAAKMSEEKKDSAVGTKETPLSKEEPVVKTDKDKKESAVEPKEMPLTKEEPVVKTDKDKKDSAVGAKEMPVAKEEPVAKTDKDKKESAVEPKEMPVTKEEPVVKTDKDKKESAVEPKEMPVAKEEPVVKTDKDIKDTAPSKQIVLDITDEKKEIPSEVKTESPRIDAPVGITRPIPPVQRKPEKKPETPIPPAEKSLSEKKKDEPAPEAKDKAGNKSPGEKMVVPEGETAESLVKIPVPVPAHKGQGGPVQPSITVKPVTAQIASPEIQKPASVETEIKKADVLVPDQTSAQIVADKVVEKEVSVPLVATAPPAPPLKEKLAQGLEKLKTFFGHVKKDTVQKTVHIAALTSVKYKTVQSRYQVFTNNLEAKVKDFSTKLHERNMQKMESMKITIPPVKIADLKTTPPPSIEVDKKKTVKINKDRELILQPEITHPKKVKAPDSPAINLAVEMSDEKPGSEGNPIDEDYTEFHYFVIRTGEEQEGPFEYDAVQAMFESGELRSEHLIWYPGLADWTPISDIEEVIEEEPSNSAGSQDVFYKG